GEGRHSGATATRRSSPRRLIVEAAHAPAGNGDAGDSARPESGSRSAGELRPGTHGHRAGRQSGPRFLPRRRRWKVLPAEPPSREEDGCTVVYPSRLVTGLKRLSRAVARSTKGIRATRS